jgi:CRISPR system Cascade subunit CasD
MGLIGASLGVTDPNELITLERSYGVGFWVENSGMALRDYQTCQAVDRPYYTRAEALEKGNVATVVYSKFYRSDFSGLGCIWTKTETPPYTLEQISEALRKPRFTPYLGRSCCLLGLPPDPRVIPDASGVEEAFRGYKRIAPTYNKTQARTFTFAQVLWDYPGDSSLGTPERIQRRRDVAHNRLTWQFLVREEAVKRVKVNPMPEETWGEYDEV